MANSLLSLPTEIRNEILSLCLISVYPIYVAYNREIFLGGPLLAESKHFLAILRTCRQLYVEGTPIFFRHNVFVNGDLGVQDDEFLPVPSDWYLLPIDGRICEHRREGLEECGCSGSPHSVPEMEDANPSEICEEPIPDNFLGLIRHLIIIIRDSSGQNHPLAQKCLFMEALNSCRARLKSLFIIGSCYEEVSYKIMNGNSTQPLITDNCLPQAFGFARCFMPSFASLCSRSPSIHIHFCALNAEMQSSYPRPNLNFIMPDENLQLRADTAISIRTHVLAEELGAGLNPFLPTISCSLVSQKENAALSNDGRYLLYFTNDQTYRVLSLEGQELDFTARRLMNLVRTEPWLHCEGFGQPGDPWVTTRVHSQSFPHGSPVMVARLRLLLGKLAPWPASDLEYTPIIWETSKRGRWLAQVPPGVFSELWYAKLRNWDHSAAEELLYEIRRWLEMDIWDMEDLPWLQEYLIRKSLSDAAIEVGQKKITDYFLRI
ncbi:Fc.00g002040.m01.CDS01 [Cosmosporella sp. VM-42]